VSQSPTTTLPPLGVALRGLASASGARAAMDWAAGLGLRGICWDAASPGGRPRELDRSARRDIAASLKRRELTLTGVDLPIPPAHFVSVERQERAFEAAEAAMRFASEVAELLEARPVVVMTLPAGERSTPAIETLALSAERSGTRIGARNWPPPTPSDETAAHRIGVCVDPASVLLGGGDPMDALVRGGERLEQIRLSDIGAGGRLAPGEGRLALKAYAQAIAMLGWSAPVTLDLEGVGSQGEAAAATIERWSDLSRRSGPTR